MSCQRAVSPVAPKICGDWIQQGPCPSDPLLVQSERPPANRDPIEATHHPASWSAPGPGSRTLCGGQGAPDANFGQTTRSSAGNGLPEQSSIVPSARHALTPLNRWSPTQSGHALTREVGSGCLALTLDSHRCAQCPGTCDLVAGSWPRRSSSQLMAEFELGACVVGTRSHFEVRFADRRRARIIR